MSGDQREVFTPLAGYADKQAKLALLFGKWWKHYIDALAYIDQLRYGEQRFFVFGEPTAKQLSEGRKTGKNKFDVELTIPVEVVASSNLISEEVFDKLVKETTEFYLSRGLDDLQASVPAGYRVAAASDVSYIDKSSGFAFPKKAALDVEQMARKILEEMAERRQEEKKAP